MLQQPNRLRNIQFESPCAKNCASTETCTHFLFPLAPFDFKAPQDSQLHEECVLLLLLLPRRVVLQGRQLGQIQCVGFSDFFFHNSSFLFVGKSSGGNGVVPVPPDSFRAADLKEVVVVAIIVFCFPDPFAETSCSKDI